MAALRLSAQSRPPCALHDLRYSSRLSVYSSCLLGVSLFASPFHGLLPQPITRRGKAERLFDDAKAGNDEGRQGETTRELLLVVRQGKAGTRTEL